MIYWFTGQPGHGKTLHAIEKLLEFKDQGRIVYACNIRQFDYGKTGVLEMTPEQFRDWPNFLPDGAVALVDEAYEHDMLPKRPPGSKVPLHVEQLAKHRHRGLDFIFVSQSPDKQCDQFVHDLIERHVHVRRRFGTKFVHLREFDKFESRPEKATPLVVRRRALPKRPMGTYQSTEMDTTERKIPWYYIALPIMLALAAFLMYYTFGSMGERMGGAQIPASDVGAKPAGQRDGASATASGPAPAEKPLSAAEYATRYIPRLSSQPWSAPAYDDKLSLPADPPRLFCMSSQPGQGGNGEAMDFSCTCMTEQGTNYDLDEATCRFVARRGQYEPYRNVREQNVMDGLQLQERAVRDIAGSRESGAVIERGRRTQGTFPESPSYTTSTVTPATSIDL